MDMKNMKNGKRMIATLTVVAVLAIAGSAIAYGGRHYGGGAGPGGGCACGNAPMTGPGNAYRQDGAPHGRMQLQPPQGEHGRRAKLHGAQNGPGKWNAEMPQNIRDKQVEAEKLAIDLRAEMSKPQIDKAKALEIWKKKQALHGEISEWRFAQRLERAANRPATPAPLTPQQ